MRIVFLVCLMVCPLMAEQQIEKPKQRLIELYKQWGTDYSNARHITWMRLEKFSVARTESWKQGGHQLYMRLDAQTSDASLLNLSDLKPGLMAHQMYWFRLVNPRYIAEVEGNPHDGWTQKQVAIRGTKQYKDELKQLRDNKPAVYRYGTPVIQQPSFDHFIVTSAVRDGDEEVFDYETKPGTEYWSKTRLVVRDGKLVEEIGSSANVNQMVMTTKGPNTSIYRRDGKVDLVYTVSVDDDKLDTARCYLSFYSLPEPLSRGFAFRPWMVGVASTLLLGVAVALLIVKRKRDRR